MRFPEHEVPLLDLWFMLVRNGYSFSGSGKMEDLLMARLAMSLHRKDWD
jgi:hypothetical protein